ncbi:MAG: type II toxin-antitoxin system VapC family toxin [Candidatus Diapherotrites archaeon]|nr:type II toxin-antitoxin system VapC family toxin [Candidatus Diapherotrites archaeon]
MRLYLDSNALISFLRSEIDRAYNLRFEESRRFFTACRVLGIELVISELFVMEVKRITGLGRKEIEETLEQLNVNFLFVENTENKKAKEIERKTGIHFTDALHIANAQETGCKLIITWNTKDFERAKNLIPCRRPSDF